MRKATKRAGMRCGSIRRVYRKSAKNKKNELYLSPEGVVVEIPCMSEKTLGVDWGSSREEEIDNITGCLNWRELLWEEFPGPESRFHVKPFIDRKPFLNETPVFYQNKKITINVKNKVDLVEESLVQDVELYLGDVLCDSAKSRTLVTNYDRQTTLRTWARLLLCRKWHPWKKTDVCNYTVILKRMDKSGQNKTFLCESSFDVGPLRKLKLFFERYPGSLKSIGGLMLNSRQASIVFDATKFKV